MTNPKPTIRSSDRQAGIPAPDVTGSPERPVARPNNTQPPRPSDNRKEGRNYVKDIQVRTIEPENDHRSTEKDPVPVQDYTNAIQDPDPIQAGATKEEKSKHTKTLREYSEEMFNALVDMSKT